MVIGLLASLLRIIKRGNGARVPRILESVTGSGPYPFTARSLRVLAVLLLIGVLGSNAHGQKRGQTNNLRDVQGIVTDDADKPVAGAVVQLKNTKTLQIISFITKDQGDYYFHGLSPDIDFELTAQQGERLSARRTLSTFDTRKQSVINLKLDRGKKD